MKVSKVFYEFYENAKGGILLILCTFISLLIANSSFSENYLSFWHYEIASLSIEQWVNDGLMAIFFTLIGLELKREAFVGELSNIKNAMLPIVAAVGGMVIPAGIYFAMNSGTETQSGTGIPMATDIAFALGVLSLLGRRVPTSLKVLLTAIAVIDDLGAILVIAIFYTSSLSFFNLVIVLALFGLMFLLNKLKVNLLSVYILIGVVMWYFMLKSGVHATLAGILFALALPFGKGAPTALSARLEDALDEPVSLIILPIFALANTAIVFAPGWDTGLLTPGSLGIFAGLILGKPVGILLFSFAAVSLGWCALPSKLKWKHVTGLGFLAGIGFTMSIFITLLAYSDHSNATLLITESKISILLASLISGVIGFTYLKKILNKKQPTKASAKKLKTTV